MPFDDSKFYAVANRGEVAGIAIVVSVALDAIVGALEGISANGKASPDDIEEIKRQAKRLGTLFDELSGWQSS